MPYAGPALITRTNPAGAAPRPNSEATAARNLRLIEYLTANRGDARYLAATLNANTAAPLILATGQPVMALGGFSGNDPILTDTELAETIAAGAVRFFLLPVAPAAPGQTAGRGQAAGQGELRLWVNEHCAPVPAAAWQPAPGSSGALAAGPGGPLQLFDCAPGSR